MDIKTLINKAGGAVATARLCGITSQAVSQWTQVPADKAMIVAKATGISAKIIRPDVFGAKKAA